MPRFLVLLTAATIVQIAIAQEIVESPSGIERPVPESRVVHNRARLLRRIHYDLENPRVKAVQLVGESGLEEREIRSAIRAMKNKRILPGIPGLWNGWTLRPGYSADRLRSDVIGISSLYISRGYLDAVVRADHVEIADGAATPQILLKPGKPYQVRSWSIRDSGIVSRLENATGEFRSERLCRCLLDLRRESEELGYLKFDVRFAVKRVPDSVDGREADLEVRVDRGAAYRLRRLEFTGNRHITDRTIRANMLLDEGDPLDSTLFRKSLEHLNQTGWFEPLDERSIQFRADPATGMADVGIRLRERRPASWFLSGPLGPMRVAGPIHLGLASRLPSWGAGILELSTYSLSFNLLVQAGSLARIVSGSGRMLLPFLAFERPYSPGEGWKSGFTIAPQLGWRATATSYGLTQARERLAHLFSGNALRDGAIIISHRQGRSCSSTLGGWYVE